MPSTTEGDESISDSSKTQLQVNGQELAPELKYDSKEFSTDDDEINDPSGKNWLTSTLLIMYLDLSEKERRESERKTDRQTDRQTDRHIIFPMLSNSLVTISSKALKQGVDIVKFASSANIRAFK